MKKLISLILVLAMMLTFAACNVEKPPESTPETTPSETPTETPEPPATEPDEPIVIAEGGEGKIYIVMPKGQSVNTVYAKDKLTVFVKSRTGVELEFGTDKDNEYELLLGNTRRDESTAHKETLTGNQFGIKIEGKQIIINATQFAFLYDAMEYFIENFLTVTDNKIVLNTTSANYVGEGDTTSLRYILSKNDHPNADISREDGEPDEVVFAAEGTSGTQGGCFDGTYVYQGFILKDAASEETRNVCKIVKQKFDGRPDTTTALKISEALDLNHTNDITYNTKTDELVVVHNNPFRTKLTVIDPKTLTVKRTVTIPINIYSLTYNAERDLYVAGCSGGQNLRILSADLSQTLSEEMISAEETKGLTTQGICSDDTFIYCTLWNSNGKGAYSKNVITVYDWYGNHVGTIGTAIEIESENISIVDGTLYVTAHSWWAGAAYIYKIEPKI